MTVQFVKSAHSEAWLNAKTTNAIATIAQLKAQGAGITNWGPTNDTGLFQVGVRGLSAAQKEQLLAAFGPDTDVVDTSAEPSAYPADRGNDGRPWYGGDFILNSNGLNCTSGFSAQSTSNGASYNTSAGHCGADSVTTSIGSSIGGPTGGSLVGTISTSAYRNSARDGLDVNFIRLANTTDNAPQIWGNSGHILRVGAVTRPSVGAAVCLDGAYEGEACGTVNSQYYNQCFTYTDGGYACHVIQVIGGITIVGGGDSGGPVYSAANAPAVDGSTVNPVGLIDGRIGASSCTKYPGRGSDCSNRALYTDIQYILSTFAMAIRHV